MNTTSILDFERNINIPREYLYYTISHYSLIINICTGNLYHQLTTLQKLIWGLKPDTQYLFQISSGLIPSSKVWCHHQLFNQIKNRGVNYCRSSYKLEHIYIQQTGDQDHLHHRKLKVIPRM